ncbi:general odorant-binding protein 67-like isoform X2 [Anopheles albimanus]|uniref:OBP47-like domain-containing protein n=1 Tax=Anopheles albimanus TaxID=7167 RepID=A0A8W7K6W0_ANOAL|nr:general odorant-binding protein 67-like isoform X2 [Anopheles albimanus]
MSPYVPLILNALLGALVLGHPGGPDHHKKCALNSTVTVKDCCNIPKLATEEVFKKCKAENPRNPANGPGRHVPCLANCILTAVGGFTNGKLDTDGFKKSVKPLLQDNAAFEPVVEAAIDTCFTKSSEPPKKTMYGGGNTDLPCSAVPMSFVNCVYTEVFKNCPATVKGQQKECAAVNAKLKEGCPYFALYKHGHKGRKQN